MQSELFQKQYDFELDQRNSIASATNIPMVAITVVASATSVILLDFRYEQGLLTYAFASLSAVTLGAIGFSVFSVFRSFWNYEYQKLSSSASLRQHYDALNSWHLHNGNTAADAKLNAETDFKEYLNSRLGDAADWNGQNNFVRGNYLHRATAAVALAVACFLPSALLYAYNKSTSDDKIHQVRLIGPLTKPHQEIQMSSTTPPSGTSQPASAPAPTPTPVPSAKPVGPPNSVFKGNSDLTKPSANTNPLKK